MQRYVELHCHSCFSFREGASTPLEVVLEARRLGYEHLALTDHDNLAGSMQFAQSAKTWGIVPITGAEVTLQYESAEHHLTLLCETARGYANLSRLLTRANLASSRREPRARFEWLAEHAEGLIALSGCRKGEVPALIERHETSAARKAAGRYRDIFGPENYFIELQENLVYEDESRNRGLLDLARSIGAGLVATNNVHYHVRERSRLHDVLVAVRHHQSLEDARPHLRANAEFYLKSPAEMDRLFADLPEAIDNTARIAERCQGFDITKDLGYVFPDYDAGDGRTADEVLREVAYSRARELYGTLSPEKVERIEKELKLIASSKRSGFFLRLWDLLHYAHENRLPVRGRGSSVGSVVCFFLGLSGIDPFKYNLPVERFLSEGRPDSDVPDVDLDFGREARAEMFRHVFREYGTEHAAMVCNFIEYRYPSAVRDVGKALGMDPAQVDQVAKLMRSRFSGSLEQELAARPDYALRLQFDMWRHFTSLVSQLLGMPRHLSQHSGGMIIATTRIDEHVPVEPSAMPDRFICQWDKDSVADAGFIKLDFLGYPSLDQLERGLGYIEERYGRVLVPARDIDLTDQEVYRMIQGGDTLGIVQIQSRAQIQILLRIRVACIDDLVIQVALIRPGPIQGGAVHPYVARCLGQEPVAYDHPLLEPVLKETKGVFVFQEQVVSAAMVLAGFTSRQAEELRRAMSRKRSREAMEALRDEFFAGAERNGVDRQTVATVYDKIVAFSSFGFPKSHAAAMAVTAFQVAWLKRYYPAEFYCALLNEQPMGFYSPEVIANDARRHHIKVRGVDVNHSEVDCTIEPGSERPAVRLGYRYVKGIGEAARAGLTSALADGPYRSLWDFWRRTGLAREGIENLIRVGAFAWTGLHETELFWQLGTFYQPLGAQLPLALNLAVMPSVALREFSKEERIATDLEVTGIAARGHAMDLVVDGLHEGITPSRLVNEMQSGQRVTVAGLVAVRQAPETAKGFVFHTLEDYDGLMNVITNPRLIPKFRQLIESAPALIVHGHIERQERSVNVIAERFEALQVSISLGRRAHDFR